MARAGGNTHNVRGGGDAWGVPEGRTDRLTDRVLALALGGASLRDLARECGVSYETVRRWVERGRGEWAALSVCGRLAAALELRALEGRFVPQGELEPGELRLLVSRAARAGDVRAMKLAVDLGLGGDSSRDELADLVGEVVPLPQRRERGGGGRAA
ncbi:helix-turn-helix domain-containing protein [Thermoleophilum album]|uniref:Helix-turn-helix domain of transposase family ISL3 n=1 Tax=Thermoleophilum album TaxID=29539 RepID=A0A1H6FLN6_THEAL|nr:Helix-turn-helix domain of transposase family ISL3 [Thermoleophilum album]